MILMNGIENGAWNFAHHFSRSTDDPVIKSLLAQTRMVEQQQQTTINWLNPFNFGLLEDFDHLYRYSELLDYLEGKEADSMQGKTEVFPGRPTSEHHNDPEVRLLRHYEKNRPCPSASSTP